MAARLEKRPAARKRRLILLVDDFADNREMYADYLTFSGFEVAEAADGIEALEMAFALRPDLIVMDLSLPGLDGWEVNSASKCSGIATP